MRLNQLQYFALLWWEYVALAGKSFTYSFYLTKRDVLQNYLIMTDENFEKKFVLRFLRSVWETSTRWLVKDVLKQDLECIQVSTFFGVNNFQNTSAMKLKFFFKIS